MGIHMGEVGMICQYQLKKNIECFNLFACCRILIKGVVADGFTTLACGIACRMIYSHSLKFLFLEFLDLQNKHSLPGWTLSRRIMLSTSNALEVTMMVVPKWMEVLKILFQDVCLGPISTCN